MTKVHRFVVAGLGSFPFDMLRYDQCWPEGQDDVGNLFNKFLAKREIRKITLLSHSHPTEARWASFMWNVISIDGRRK